MKERKGKVKAGSRHCQERVKARQKQGQGEVKARSRQRKHNLNRNYNLMGFDTIEINLVVHKMTPWLNQLQVVLLLNF